LESRGLSAKLLQKLSKEQIKDLYDEEGVEIARMFETFGLPTEGLPGTRSYGGRGGYGGYGGYGDRRW
jgi:hypothetical protein